MGLTPELSRAAKRVRLERIVGWHPSHVGSARHEVHKSFQNQLRVYDLHTLQLAEPAVKPRLV